MADLASDVAADRTADLSTTDKIGEAMRRSLPLLPGEAQGVVLDMLKPENLAIIGAAVVVWAASQFFGVGEFVDFILLVIGISALGFSVLTGARELYYFVTTAVNATSSQDLDVAGQHFAQAVLILGISVVQAVLLRGAANKVVAPSRPQVKPRIPDADPPPADSRPPVTSDLPPDAPNTTSVASAATNKGPIQAGEVTTYQDLFDRSVKGDNIEGHEVLQHANLKAQGLTTTRLSNAASQDNPVIALDKATHQQVNSAQRAFNPATQSAAENIAANVAILRKFNVAPESVISKLENFAIEHARSLGIYK
jgi:hypothetical protein